MCAAAVTSGRTSQGAGIDRYSTASSSEIGAVEPGAAAGAGGGGRVWSRGDTPPPTVGV